MLRSIFASSLGARSPSADGAVHSGGQSPQLLDGVVLGVACPAHQLPRHARVFHRAPLHPPFHGGLGNLPFPGQISSAPGDPSANQARPSGRPLRAGRAARGRDSSPAQGAYQRHDGRLVNGGTARRKSPFYLDRGPLAGAAAGCPQILSAAVRVADSRALNTAASRSAGVSAILHDRRSSSDPGPPPPVPTSRVYTAAVHCSTIRSRSRDLSVEATRTAGDYAADHEPHRRAAPTNGSPSAQHGEAALRDRRRQPQAQVSPGGPLHGGTDPRPSLSPPRLSFDRRLWLHDIRGTSRGQALERADS